MNKEFIDSLFNKHQQTESFPSTSAISKLITKILLTLFPEQAKKRYKTPEDLSNVFQIYQSDLTGFLAAMSRHLNNTPEELAVSFLKKIPGVYEDLLKDIEAILKGDPAAKDEYEIIRTYPGFYAIAFYRLAHALHQLEIPLLPRVLTEFAHSRTGIDIHPGAVIQPYLFIDHGTGVVIGETAQIGKNVKIYQGVTLGALSVSKDMAEKKRHPTIEDNVVIYAGATILGGETVIGKNSVIGGNVWLTNSVPPFSMVYHQSQTKINSNT